VKPRILYADIETAPTVADVWSLRDLSVGINQIKVHPRTIGVGYMWAGDKRPKFVSEYHHGHAEMVTTVRELLDQADAMCGYNSQGFDAKHLNAEFVEAGLTPPSPYKHLDLYRVVRANFRWPSFKLQYVSQRLDIGSKVTTGGHSLWTDCLGDDEERKRKAWALMSRYCRQDVALLPLLHERLKPWLTGAMNMAVYDPDGGNACQKCGSTNLESRGTAYTAQRAYPQFRCNDCGGWTRDSRSSWSINTVGVTR
jgi:uncharacterized protein